jgi:FMNH2-dependent dimethyl sulfone monooxygenase
MNSAGVLAPFPNPIFNVNKLKLGIFSHNGTGNVQTTAPEGWHPTWADTLRLSRAADAAGLEAIVPYSRWRGPIEGKGNHRTSHVFDTYTWAAGISQATEQAGVFCTSHVPTIHPLSAAKQCSTIDHISNGRFALNVVAGWNKLELDMFGTPVKGHDDRYEQAIEWVELLKQLWTAEEEFDYEIRFYQVKGGISLPHPNQKPFPPIVNAGSSSKGLHFAAKYSDIAFVVLRGPDPEQWRRQVDEYRNLARDEYGREIQGWTFASLVHRDTDAEALALLKYYSETHLDAESLDAMMEMQGLHTGTIPPGQFAAICEAFARGGGLPLIGTSERIMQTLEQVVSAGIEGVLLTWFDYEQGLDRWVREMLPLMEQAGMRKAVR